MIENDAIDMEMISEDDMQMIKSWVFVAFQSCTGGVLLQGLLTRLLAVLARGGVATLSSFEKAAFSRSCLQTIVILLSFSLAFA